jgi:O-acetylserine/cysteine efflux transporter
MSSNKSSPDVSLSSAPLPQSAHRAVSPSMQSLAAMLLLACIWGLSIPVTKLGLLTLPPLTLTALRFAIAVPLLLICAVGMPLLPWRALPRFIGLGVLGIGVGQVFQAFGVAGTSASVGTVISATIPVMVVFFAAIRLKQRVTGLQKLGLLAAFIGIALVASGHGEEASEISRTTLSGVAWLLLSALAIAFYYVWSVEITLEYGAAAVAAWSSLFGFISLLPGVVWELWSVSVSFTAQAVWAAVYLGVAVSVVGLFLWLNLLRTVQARIAASVQYLQPVVGVAASSAMFGDRLGVLFFFGVLLVLVGLALSMTSRSQRKPKVS